LPGNKVGKTVNPCIRSVVILVASPDYHHPLYDTLITFWFKIRMAVMKYD